MTYIFQPDRGKPVSFFAANDHDAQRIAAQRFCNVPGILVCLLAAHLRG